MRRTFQSMLREAAVPAPGGDLQVGLSIPVTLHTGPVLTPPVLSSIRLS